MPKYVKKSHFTITQLFILLGKPAFFLFTFTVVLFVSLFQLFTKYILRFTTFAICYTIYYFILKDLPSISNLHTRTPSLTTKIYDRNGTLLYQIYKDENRTLIALDSLPQHVLDATIAAEDKNFYHHFGLDPIGIMRAFTNNLVNCKLQINNCNLQGGSTITQQLVKNTLLNREKTLIRKLKEGVLAVLIEFKYSKNEILEMYLNEVAYGGTAYGIEQASWQYFGKSAKDLSLAEAALLAGLPISPTTLSPFGTNPYLAKIRQAQVLDNMVKAKQITQTQKFKAQNTTLSFAPQGMSIQAPHFVMYIKDLLVKKYGETIVDRGGLNVITTLDLNIQNILQSQIETELNSLAKLHVQNGAGLVLNPQTGEILAMVGSRNFFDSTIDGQVNVTLQARQPGSSIKPITYSLALSRGLSPSFIIHDTPICFVSHGSPDYCPKNYDGRFHGKVTLRQALASSYNIPAVKLLNQFGINNMIELARLMGISTWDDPRRYGLSLTLGGGEVTMLDLASVYSVFANNGFKVPLSPFISIKDSSGSDLAWGDSSTGDMAKGQVGTPKVGGVSPKGSQILDPSIAYQINSILSDPIARAPAFGYHSVLNLPGPNVAVKTGTTNSLRDNWTFGYTSNLLVATWVGNNDNTPMSSVASGITGASPIWAKTMKELLGHGPRLAFTPPANLVKVNISCSNSPKYEYFNVGNIPKINCAKLSGTILETAATTSQ